MGETAELILEGILCEACGGVMDDVTEDSPVPGHPRSCEDCK